MNALFRGLPPIRTLHVIAVTALTTVTMSVTPLRNGSLRFASAAGTNDLILDDLFLVTEDIARPIAPGCDGISTFVVNESPARHLGTTHPSPGRLTATSDFAIAIASPSNGLVVGGDSVYATRCASPETGGCTDYVLRGLPQPLQGGGLAISHDDRHLFLAVKRIEGIVNPSEQYGVSRFDLREINWDASTLGPGVGFVNVGHGQPPSPSGESNSSFPTELLPTSDGTLVHVVVEPGLYSAAAFVLTIDAKSMHEVGSRIPIVANHAQNEDPNSPRSGSDLFFPGNRVTHATLSTDERFIVINRWESARVTVVDLATRASWEISIPGFESADTIMARNEHAVGGVAINTAPVNTGLLAIHGIDRISVFEVASDFRSLTLRSQTSVDPAFHYGTGVNGDASAGNFGIDTGPVGAVAWSGSGQFLIAAGAAQGSVEFTSWRVDPITAQLTESVAYEACDHQKTNLQNDIFTRNGRLPSTAPSPEPSATAPVQQPSATATATATATAGATVTRAPTENFSPTSPPTAGSAAVLLPLIVRERCVPEQQLVDVVLVIDASTSMLESGGSGSNRSKLEIAQMAAENFIEGIGLARGDRVAVVTFNSSAVAMQSLTSDLQLLRRALRGIQTATQTRIDLGMELGYQILRTSARSRQRAIVLLTDGRANPVGPERAVRIAQEAKATGIQIATVGLGAELDLEALKEMASDPTLFFQSQDGSEVATIYAQLARSIPCPPHSFWPQH